MPVYRRRVLLLSLLILLLPLYGCFDLPSLNPLCDATTTVTEPALAGLWQASDGSDILAVRMKGNVYEITYTTNDLEVERFTGHLTEIGGVKVMDLQREKSWMAEHHFMRVQVSGDQLMTSYLDSEWLRQLIRADSKPAHVTYDDGKRMLLTASTKEMREAFSTLAKDARAFDKEVHTFRRVKQ